MILTVLKKIALLNKDKIKGKKGRKNWKLETIFFVSVNALQLQP